MCGLVAVFDRSGRPVDDGLVFRMRDTIVHRGPDDAGLAHPAASSDHGTEPAVALGSRRLAISQMNTPSRKILNSTTVVDSLSHVTSVRSS